MWSGVLFGLGFGALMVGLGLLLGRDREPALFAVVLGAAQGVYVGGALADPGGSAAVQALGIVLFVGVAVLGRRSAGILAAGWLGHALWDLAHLAAPVASGLPEWYEVACLVADPVIAGYLLIGAVAPGGRGRDSSDRG